MNKKVVVLGVNHAGTSAVKTLLLQDPTLEVVGYESQDTISFLGCGIALAVGGVVKDTTSLFYASNESLSSLGAKIHSRHEVLAIDHQKKKITVRNLVTNETFEDGYDVLIYAAGSWPFILPFHKPEYKGIKLCKTYKQALQLIEDAKSSNVKDVVILGAGYIGIELTEAYAHCADKKNVTLIDMENRIIPRYFDTEFTSQMEAHLVRDGVQMLMNSKVTGMQVDHDNNVTGLDVLNVLTNETKSVKADLVISCVGFAPNTKLLLATLPELGTSRNKAIHVNKHAQALDVHGNVVDDLYVIGDSAAPYYIPTKSYENVALATNAVKLGLVAACHICADKKPQLKGVKLDSITGTNAISVFGYSYSSTGLSAEGAKRLGIDADSAVHVGNDRCEFMNEYEQVTMKIVYEKNSLRLIGAQIGSADSHSHTEAIYMLSLAIQKEMTLLDLLTTDVYFLPHLNKPFNFILCTLCKALGLHYGDHEFKGKHE